MSLEAKRFRHVTVAIPVFAIAGVLTAGPRQQNSQPQQPDLAQHQTLIGGRSRQPFDRGLGFGQVIFRVTVGAAVEQRLDQNTCRRNAPQQQPPVAEQMVDRRCA